MSTRQKLLQEIEDLRASLQEARETLDAIRNGQVDAIVVSGDQGETVFTLQNADYIYRRLIEEMDEGAGTLSADGAILYCNQCFADMLQVPLQALIGTSIRQFILPSEVAPFEAMLQQAVADAGQGEISLQRPDGTRVPAYLALSQAPIEGARAVCMVATDLSLQKRNEQIVADEQLARSILEQAAQPIVVCDVNGLVIRASQAAHDLCGGNPILRPFDALFHLHTATGDALRLFAQPGTVPAPCRNLETTFARPDGQTFSLIVSVGPLANRHGEPIGSVITLTDITEREIAERQLKELNETLEQRVRERTAEAEHRATQLRSLAGQLTQAEQRERSRLATILHDHLQQLLVGAKFNARILSEQLPDDALRQQLNQVDELLDQSLETSRSLTAELSAPALYQKDLPATLHWLARQMREKHRLAVDVQADPQANPRDEEIRVLLFQAVRELLFNIVKHADVRRARVHMGPTPRDGSVTIRVTDEGAGFDPQKKLAAPSGTTGFGLFSIRERLELMGGRMHIDSAPGRGTRVELTAPISNQPAAPEVAPPAEAMPEPPVQSTVACTRGCIRVLLADDHAVVRKGLARLLQTHPDIEVIGQAADGQQAVDLALETRPDIVVMDVTMPGLDGLEATRRIHSQLPAVKVIGLSMHASEDIAGAMAAAGAVSYLAKTSPPEILIATIRAHAPGGTLPLARSSAGD